MNEHTHINSPGAGEALLPIVTIQPNGEVMADSRDIAVYFGKQNKHVLEKIRDMDCSENFRRSNFRPIEINDLTGTSTSHVLMTKDGFAFVVLGFTGDKAAKFKEAYITEFNRMEAQTRLAPSGVAVTKLDKEVKRVIGNMIKQCTGVVLRDEIGPIIAKAVHDAQRREDMHPTVDMTSTVTAADMFDLVQVKGRFRGTTQFITREMLKFTKKEGCWRTPAHVDRRQPWRFPREKAQEWLFGACLGAELVRSYVAGRTERRAKASLPVDQKVIQFRAPSTSLEGGAA